MKHKHMNHFSSFFYYCETTTLDNKGQDPLKCLLATTQTSRFQLSCPKVTSNEDQEVAIWLAQCIKNLNHEP